MKTFPRVTVAVILWMTWHGVCKAESPYHAVLLDSYIQGGYASDWAFKPSDAPASSDGQITMGGIPFQVVFDDRENWEGVDVGRSRWKTCEEDESGTFDPKWCHASAKNGDLVFHLPKAIYFRAHVLAASDGDPGKDPVLAFRCGAFEGRGFLADKTAQVPPFGPAPGPDPLPSVAGETVPEQGNGKAGRLFLVSVPLPVGDVLKAIEAIGEGAEYPLQTFDIQLTGRLHVKVSAPDPFNFSILPLGAPSAVRVFAITFEITPSPVFVEGVAACREVSLGEPAYAEPALPRSRLLSRLDSLESWMPVAEANPDLDDANFDMRRQRGEFAVSVADDSRRGPCFEFGLKQAGHRPPWIPSYQALSLEAPLPIPEKPTSVGLYVRGNSGWGRINLELRDAKGEKWTSVGMPDAWNANDEQSVSYIVFDGWRWMDIPLPGHYAGGFHWPRYANWRHDGGDGVVDYPLSLTGIIVEQRKKIVYVNEMVDASSEPVRLSSLTAVYGDPERVDDWESPQDSYDAWEACIAR